MAKNTQESPEQPDSQNTQESSERPDSQNTQGKQPDSPKLPVRKPDSPKLPVYTFRKNGTNRTFDVDDAHVQIMRDRSDLTYIGTIPLPEVKNEKGFK